MILSIINSIGIDTIKTRAIKKIYFFHGFATVHFYNKSKEKGIKATGIGIE